ncbi:MAG: MG2 domain-containing protein [Planctomycetota bacterium]|nr:MG2 domain-containing protein [Planctomycetota bacterium]
MRTRCRFGLMAVGLLCGIGFIGTAWVLAQKSSGKLPGVELPDPKAIKKSLVADWPSAIAGLMQAGKYGEARASIDNLEATRPVADADTRAFYDLVRSISFRLEGNSERAAELIEKRLKADPSSGWAGKLRGELAACRLAAGKPSEAQALARADVERLLSGARKDSLANVYRGFARQLLEPSELLTKPDYGAARPFLEQALEVAESQGLKDDLTYDLARLSINQGVPNEAIDRLARLVREESRVDRKRAAHFDLGLAQYGAGDSELARRTWSDLARELEPETARDRNAAALRADCLYATSMALGLMMEWDLEQKPNVAPTPVRPFPTGNDQRLSRVVQATRKALENDPSNARAVRASFVLGSMLSQKPAEAVEQWRQFLAGTQFRAESETAQKDLARYKPEAAFELARGLRMLLRFDESQAAFLDYSKKYPDGSNTAQALQDVIDIEIAKAVQQLLKKEYAAYRESVKRFVAANPLHRGVPDLLYTVGNTFIEERNWLAAIGAWKVLIARFPKSAEADMALYQSGMVYENHLGELSLAIETYRRVISSPYQEIVLQRVAMMEQKSLAVVTPRVFRSNETAKLKISTRNIERLTFTAYRIDPETYFRKKHMLGNVEQLDIGLVKPDAEWSVEVPGQARYKPVDLEYELKQVVLPGVWVVKVTDDKTFQATTMVIGSDLDAIVKTSRDQLLVYVQNMAQGTSKPAARVLVSDGANVLVDELTGADGVLLKDWPAPRANHSNHRVLVMDGPQVATTSAATTPNESARGLSAKALILTDRPAYRPGQTVQLRGIVREISQSRFEAREGSIYTLEVSDSRGRRLESRPVTITRFGTFSASVPLDGTAPLGTYAVRLFQQGGSSFGGQFMVEEYELPKVVLSLELPRSIFERGEKVSGKVVARYAYGTPLAGRQVLVRLPDGQTRKLTTDEAGTAAFEMPSDDLFENNLYDINATLPDEGVSTAAQFAIPGASFTAKLSTSRSTYLVDETIPVRIHTDDALGKPTGQPLTLVLARREHEGGRLIEQEVSRQTIQTDVSTGHALGRLKVEDKRGGTHVLRVMGLDRFSRPVTAELVLEVSGLDDPSGLRLIADQTQWRLGTDASVILHARHQPGQVLVCFEADRMLGYKILPIKVGENNLRWKVVENQFPNMTITATRMRDQIQDVSRLDVRVERGLAVSIKPLADQVKPGQPVEVELTTTDQNGQPVAAELSIGLVDKALLRLFGDNRPNLQSYFYDQSRVGAFATTTTNVFKYTPATIRVPESLVEEAERQAAQMANNASLEEAKRKSQTASKSFGVNQMPASAAAAPAKPEGRLREGLGLGVDMLPGGAPGFDNRGGLMGGMGGGMMGGGRRNQDRSGGKREIDGLAEETDKLAVPGQQPRRAMAKADADSKQRVELGASVFFADGPAKAGQEPPARERLIETAYWNPSIVTDSSGKAKISILAPNALGEYEFDGKGVTATETLVGQATADLAVRKPFFIELLVPNHLTEADRIKPSARLHHAGVKGEVTIILERYANGQTSRDPKTIVLSGDGVTMIGFEELAVPASREIRFEVTARAGDVTDKETRTVPVNLWGTPVLASAHGSGRDDQTLFVQLPEGRAYENLGMMVTIAPTLERQVLAAALGAEVWPMPRDRWTCILPPPWDTTSNRASDLLAVTSALTYLRQVGGGSTALDQGRLVDRIRGLSAELVARQNEDGGWPLTAPGPKRLQATVAPMGSDPVSSAKVLLALALAKQAAVVDPGETLTKAAAYVKSTGGQSRPWQLLALAHMGQIGFEELNALSRNRQQLDSLELASLALAWVKLERRALADEVLTTLLARSLATPTAPGKPVQRYWPAGVVGTEITTAWATWAVAEVRPAAEGLPQAVDWLNSHRFGPGWLPYETKGASVAALSAWYGRAQAAEDRYRMAVRVNDQLLDQFAVDGVSGSAVRVWNVPAAMIKPGQNKISFDVEGRARFGYGIELTGFSRDFRLEQKPEGKHFMVRSRDILASDPELDGMRLPSGFGTVVNPSVFQNRVSQLLPGGKAKVQLHVSRTPDGNADAHSGDLVVVEESLPAGVRLVEGSITGTVLRTEQELGLLRFYLDPRTLGDVILGYEVFGAFEGRCRLRPTRVYTLSQPGSVHASAELDLSLLPAGSKLSDNYKPTPDELYARGQKLFEKGRLAESAAALEALSAGYTLQDGPARETARMLLDAHIASKEPRKIVQDFEILKLKAADLVLPIHKIRAVGEAYAAIGESERAWLVWRAVLDAGYIAEAQLGKTLSQTGRPLESVVYLINTWQSYPGSASQQSDFFGLSRLINQLATSSESDPELRRRLMTAQVTRSDLLLQSIAMTQIFLTLTPNDPLADEANLALIGDLASLDAHQSVVKLAEQAARLYPKSRFLDSFQFGEALARFNLGELDQAIAIAQKIAETTYEEPGGVRRPSPNRNQALYIMGQIYDARRNFPKALDQYRLVKDQFPDAAVAVKALERKALGLPEVTLLPTTPENKPVTAKIRINYRNMEKLELKVYPVDLLRLYLSKQNLDQIGAVDLAGIKPLMESSVNLGDGKDFADKTHELQLQVPGEGAYLVMVRGGDLFASGIVLATPIELEVMEEADARRVRVTAREAFSGKPLPKLQVKLSASLGQVFRDGLTDMRGVYVADGLNGLVTVVVRQSAGRYAFFRGKTPLGGIMVQQFAPSGQPNLPESKGGESQSLDQNLRGINQQNSFRQMERLKSRYEPNTQNKGVQIESVK